MRHTLLSSLLSIAAASAACAPARPSMAGTSPGLNAEQTQGNSRLERAYKVKKSEDEFTKDSIVELVFQDLRRDSRVACTNIYGPPSSLSLMVRKFVDRESGRSVLLNVSYAASDWLFATSEESLHLLLDGSVTSLSTRARPKTDVGSGGTVYEDAWYYPTTQQLKAMAEADSARIRVVGTKGRCDFPLTEQGKSLLGMFVERELGDSP